MQHGINKIFYGRALIMGVRCKYTMRAQANHTTIALNSANMVIRNIPHMIGYRLYSRMRINNRLFRTFNCLHCCFLSNMRHINYHTYTVHFGNYLSTIVGESVVHCSICTASKCTLIVIGNLHYAYP